MKTWAKVGIGCLIALLLACIISIVVVVVTGGSLIHKVKGFVEHAESAGHSQTALLKLNQQFPFSTPADGKISEQRLVAYLNVCKQLKGDSNIFQAWLKSKQSMTSGPALSVEMVKKYRGLSVKAAQALKSSGMGPTEFLWTRNALMGAAVAQPGSGLTEGMKQVLRVLEDQLNSPNLTAGQKANLRKQIADIKAGSGASQTLSENGKLYARYKNTIEANNIDPILFVFSGQPMTTK